MKKLKKELKEKVSQILAYNYVSEPIDRIDQMFYIINNHLTKKEQMIILYKIYLKDGNFSNEILYELFGFKKTRYIKEVHRISNKIQKIQLKLFAE